MDEWLFGVELEISKSISISPRYRSAEIENSLCSTLLFI